MKEFFKKNKLLFMILILIVFYFSFSIIITWDSAHYLSYVNIFEGKAPFSSWDIARGPVFPIILYLFNLLFGKMPQGILLGTFAFYLVFAIIVYCICKKIFSSFKHSKIWTILITGFCILNPVIFGYYHVLLTEFVAITLSILSCYLAWKWWNADSKKAKILIALYFLIAVPFSYHLKQPYICSTIIPMVIAAILALIHNHKWKNVLYYSGTVVGSLLVMALSIITWNKILEWKGVDMKTGRDTSSLLSGQLLQGIQYFQIENDFDFTLVDSNPYLTEEEKVYIKENLNEQENNLQVISIMNHNKIIEQDIIVVDQYQKPSTKDALAQIIKTFFKHPTIIMKNYLKNYCALSSVCLIESPDGVNYKVTNQYDFMKLFENETIAYRVSSHLDNRFYLNDQGNILSQNYQQVNTPGILIEIEKALKMPTSIIYKFSILLLPVALLALIFIRVLRRKHLKAYSLYTLSLILLGYAFLGVLANALSGSIIDRYSVGMFIPGLLGIISLITFLILNIKLEKGEITNEKRKS